MPQKKNHYPKTKRTQARLFDQIIDAGRVGKSHAQMAQQIGIDRKTLDQWVAENSDFADAMRQADDYALAWWEALGQRHAETREGNAAMIIFVMKNRFGADYGESPQSENKSPEDQPDLSELSLKARKKLRKVLQAEIAQRA